MILQKFLLSVIVIFLTLIQGSLCTADHSPSLEEELHAEIGDIFQSRAKAIITGADPGEALADYDTEVELGRWAFSHEQAKLNYIQSWAQRRGVRITEAKPALSIPWSRIQENRAELVLFQTLQVSYVYPGDPTVNSFGIGTRHWMGLVRKDGKWLIQKDFYTDGLGDDTLAPNPTPADGPAAVEGVENCPSPQIESSGKNFNRERAVWYADQYAGLAWGAGNNNQYNSRYRDFNDRGGDCTNFVSQCLADAEGGRLPMDGIWYYDRADNSGSYAWVQADSFGDWVMFSGCGQRVARGTFSVLNSPGEKFPRGAVRELREGDVIGNGEKSFSKHLAIVVGYDSKGYPLVNAHNVDRYHCPWDLGYDKTTVFHLYQINGR